MHSNVYVKKESFHPNPEFFLNRVLTQHVAGRSRENAESFCRFFNDLFRPISDWAGLIHWDAEGRGFYHKRRVLWYIHMVKEGSHIWQS